MAVMEISILPVGTRGPSVSRYVARAIGVLKRTPGIKYELTAMGTIVEGDLDVIMRLAREMHQSAFDPGARRVVTTIKIDDRRDKELTIEGKVTAVRKKLRL